MLGRSLKCLKWAATATQRAKASGKQSFSDVSVSGNGVGTPVSKGRPNSFAEEAAGKSRLFDTIKPAPEVEQALSREESGSTAGRLLSGLGNAIFFGSLAAGAFFGYYTMRYTTEQIETMVEQTKETENSFLGSQAWTEVMSWYATQRANMEAQIKKYSDPPSDRLLPDLHPQIRHVQTLVLDLDDLLVHSHWTRGRGWRTFKRPGASDLIKHLAPYFEVVIYTSQLATYADPIVDRLDPHHVIQYRLYRDSTQYQGGKHMRDLSKLNRDPTKVLFITADPSTASLQPENAVVVKKWKMETDDTTLLDLIPFLEAVCSARQVDIRDVIRSYEGQDIPTAFRQRIKEAAERQRQVRLKSKSLFGGLSGK